MDINILMEKEINGLMSRAEKYYKKNEERKAFFKSLRFSILKKVFTRKSWKKKGVQIPPALIASVASSCNLNCTGCYARSGGGCLDNASLNEMTSEQWGKVFEEADSLGIFFVLLAGGEPTLRLDVIEEASKYKKMIFPIFTNGTLVDDKLLNLYKENENLIPVISVEGNQEETDSRRGDGVYSQINNLVTTLNDNNIMFGASITVTKENIGKVTSDEFISSMHDNGCGALFYVEYVPTDESTQNLVLDEEELKDLEIYTDKLKNKYDDMIVISFPGDEEMMGGCLAAGRGFFHINPSGGAEPCPFSPYSKTDLKKSTIIDILKSDYFESLRELTKENHTHYGGCTLFNQKDNVVQLLDAQ